MEGMILQIFCWFLFFVGGAKKIVNLRENAETQSANWAKTFFASLFENQVFFAESLLIEYKSNKNKISLFSIKMDGLIPRDTDFNYR